MNGKLFAVGAVFMMIAVAFAGMSFVSEEADAAATLEKNSDGYYTKIEGSTTDVGIKGATLDVAIGCTVNITLSLRPVLTGDSIGLTLDSTLTGTITSAGTAVLELRLPSSDTTVVTITFVAHEPGVYSANTMGSVDLCPKSGDVITVTNVASYTIFSGASTISLDTSTNTATITVAETATGRYIQQICDWISFKSTSGNTAFLHLLSNENFPAGYITSMAYQPSNPIYVTNGTVFEWTADYDVTDEMTFYMDYEKVTSVTSGVGLTLDSTGNLSGTVTAPVGTTFYVEWARSYSYSDDGLDDESGKLTFIVVGTTSNHTVTYSGNGNTGGSTVDTVVTASGSDAVSVTLASNGFTKTGYSFTGWLVNGTVYQPGDTVSVAADATVTATAQWAENTLSASAKDIDGISALSYSNQISALTNNGGTLSYAVKSCSGGSATVNGNGLVTFKCPTVSSTTSYTVTVTVTATFADGSKLTQDVSFSVSVDPIFDFTNSVTSGQLSVKGKGA